MNDTCGNVYGSSCHFACRKGYKLTGSVKRTCDKMLDRDEVHWTGNETSCESKLICCITFVFRSLISSSTHDMHSNCNNC